MTAPPFLLAVRVDGPNLLAGVTPVPPDSVGAVGQDHYVHGRTLHCIASAVASHVCVPEGMNAADRMGAARQPLQRGNSGSMRGRRSDVLTCCGRSRRCKGAWLCTWDNGAKAAAFIAFAVFAVLQTQRWVRAFYTPVWTLYQVPENPWPFPQVLVCPQYVEPHDHSSLQPGAIRVEQCKFWGGHTDSWWDVDCLASVSMVPVTFFGNTYHCGLLNVDGGLTGLKPRSVLKLNVSLANSVTDDGTKFALLGLYEQGDTSFLHKDLVDGQVLAPLSAGIKSKVYLERHEYESYEHYETPAVMFQPWPKRTLTNRVEVASVVSLPMMFTSNTVDPEDGVVVVLPSIVLELIADTSGLIKYRHVQTVTFNTLSFIASMGGALAAVKYGYQAFMWFQNKCRKTGGTMGMKGDDYVRHSSRLLSLPTGSAAASARDSAHLLGGLSPERDRGGSGTAIVGGESRDPSLLSFHGSSHGMPSSLSSGGLMGPGEPGR